MIYKDISKKIKKLRKKLYFEIEKSGIESEKTIKVSQELDDLITEYYAEKNINIKNNIMYNEYKLAYDQIKKIVKNSRRFPSIKEWNKTAKKQMYLNNKSIEYISRS